MPAEITKAKKLLKEICIKYKKNNKYIMQGIKGEELHALDVLGWVKKLNPGASLPLKLATLFHDVDRIVTPMAGGGFKGARIGKKYEKHKKIHALRSAKFIIPLLKKVIDNKKIIKKTKFLIIHHDDTREEVEEIKNKDLNYLVASDSLSFFTTIAPKLYAGEGEERIKDKIRFMVEKMPEFARKRLKKQKLKNKIFDSLKNKIVREYYKNK